MCACTHAYIYLYILLMSNKICFSTLARDYLTIAQQKHHMLPLILPLSYSSPLPSNNHSGGNAIISSLSQVHSHEAIQWFKQIRAMAEIRCLFAKVNPPLTPILTLPFNNDRTLDSVLSLFALAFPYFVE